MNRQTEENILFEALEMEGISITAEIRRAVKNGLRNIRIEKYAEQCSRKEKAACAMAMHRRQKRAKVIREDAETGERTVFPGRSLDTYL